MDIGLKSLIVFTLACTVAAAVFGVGSEVLAFRAAFEGNEARSQVVLLARLAAFVTLGVLLVFRSGWRGTVAALVMVLGATAVEWALFPLAYELAMSQTPAVPERFPDTAVRPTYISWAIGDVVGVGVCALLAQGIRLMLTSTGQPTRDG